MVYWECSRRSPLITQTTSLSTPWLICPNGMSLEIVSRIYFRWRMGFLFSHLLKSLLSSHEPWHGDTGDGEWSHIKVYGFIFQQHYMKKVSQKLAADLGVVLWSNFNQKRLSYLSKWRQSLRVPKRAASSTWSQVLVLLENFLQWMLSFSHHSLNI